MLKHYFSIIFRNFRRAKNYFFINLISLSVGLTCFLLIYLWVSDELCVDKFHKLDSRLYQVMKNSQEPGSGIGTYEWTPGPLASALAEEMPEVEYAVTVMQDENSDNGILSINNNQFFKVSELYASKDFFNIFSYNLIHGEKNQVLKDKNAIIISDDLAEKLFNTTHNIVGKIVSWKKGDYNGDFMITGVFKRATPNSTYQFDILLNFEFYKEKEPDVNSWQNGGPSTFLVLKKGVNSNPFNKKISTFLQKKSNEDYQSLFIRKFSDKYLYSEYENGIQSGGRITYVKLFSFIALFIIVLACINFMTLSTAQASRKINEVGIKKTLGVNRRSLIIQYILESSVIAFLSLLIAVLSVILFLPQFNEITGKHISLNFNLPIVLSIIAITIFTSLLSGSYPALYFSGVSPIDALKTKMNNFTNELLIRKGLVIFQFTISIILIVSVIVIYNQIKYIQHKNLGFNKENIISIKKEGRLTQNLESFLIELKNIPGIINASSYEGNLTINNTGTKGVSWEGQADNNLAFKYLNIDYDFVETLGLKMKEGRSFSKEFSSEDSKIIFNEAAIKSMGIDNPIGKTVIQWGKSKQIIGVVQDFNFESLYESIKPCFLQLKPNRENIIIKIEAKNTQETLNQLRKLYQKFNMGLPFEYKFFNEDYQSFYASEIRIGILSRYFALIAIIITTLGLYGLATYTVEKKRKEISLRKIMGASNLNIIYLISSNFTKLIIISVFIALPISYWILRNWLDYFVYKIEMQEWYFIYAGLIALLIAWVTISILTIRTTRLNLLESLRSGE